MATPTLACLLLPHQTHTSSYSHKLLVLLDEVLRRIAGFLVKEDRLELIRERTLKAYRNQRFQQPYQVREGRRVPCLCTWYVPTSSTATRVSL